MIKVLELFAGIGACSKALERLGIEHEIVDAVEIDKFAIKSFNAVHGTNFEPQDITKWDKDIECDLIMHGSPCQDFSVAGLGKGGDKGSGTRSSLMYETLRIVEKLKPKYVIWENVKNLLSKKHRHNFDAYIESMKRLGYINSFQILNAKDYGIPQNRERVFTVSIREDIWDKAYDDSNQFKFPKPIELKRKLKDMLEDEVDEKYYISENMMNYFMGINQKPSKFPRRERFLANINRNDKDRANSITTAPGQRPTDNFVVASRGRGKNNEQHLEPRNDGLTNTITSVAKDNYVAEPTPLQKEVCNKAIQKGLVEPNDAIEYTYSNAHLKEIDNGYIKKQNLKDNTVMSTLKCNPQQIGVCVEGGVAIKTANKKGYDMAANGDSIDLAYPSSQTRRGRVGHGVAKTLATTDTMGTMQGLRIRKLTPKECWRLMGFNDDDFERAKASGVSNSQLYKQAGNSIVVNVLEAILRRLLDDKEE